MKIRNLNRCNPVQDKTVELLHWPEPKHKEPLPQHWLCKYQYQHWSNWTQVKFNWIMRKSPKICMRIHDICTISMIRYLPESEQPQCFDGFRRIFSNICAFMRANKQMLWFPPVIYKFLMVLLVIQAVLSRIRLWRN